MELSLRSNQNVKLYVRIHIVRSLWVTVAASDFNSCYRIAFISSCCTDSQEEPGTAKSKIHCTGGQQHNWKIGRVSSERATLLGKLASSHLETSQYGLLKHFSAFPRVQITKSRAERSRCGCYNCVVAPSLLVLRRQVKVELVKLACKLT